jgi:prepilin-type N-terminal cleavage/methylation domain-containing protein
MDAPHFGVYPRAMRHHTGFTLIELAIVLAAGAILLTLALPRLQHAWHGAAVRSAQAELAGAATAARAAAVLAGGATLFIDPVSGSAWIETRAGVRLLPDYPVGARYGVRLETPKGASIAVRYDALGIGRLANATVTLRRGHADAGITISAYGRVRL